MTPPRRLMPYPAQSLPLEQPTVADLPPADTGGSSDLRDLAVPATAAGLRLGRALMSQRVYPPSGMLTLEQAEGTDGLPSGCAYRETAEIICAGRGAAVAQLELWHSPSAAAATRGVRIDPAMANCWVMLLDGELVSQHAYRHRGPAIDRLAAAAPPPPDRPAPGPRTEG